MRQGADDSELDAMARLAAAGDRHAFGVLCSAIEGDIWRYCRSVLRDASAADDATQETFARVVKGMRRFRGDAPVRVWALVIARRVCSDTIRRRRDDVALDERRARHVRPTSLHGARLSTAETESLLGELSDDDRTAFVLTQLLGFSYADAADVADVPVGTIRSRVHRARDRLATAWVDSDAGEWRAGGEAR